MKQALFSLGVALCLLGTALNVNTCSERSAISTEKLHRHAVNITNGSAVVFADGWVLTAKHVAESLPEDVEHYDHPQLDVSLVKWDTEGKTAVELAPQSPGVGFRVFLVGFSMGRTAVVSGGFSGEMPQTPFLGTGTYEAGPGLSGGAVLNESGDLVGIHVGTMLVSAPDGFSLNPSPPESVYVRVESFQEWLDALVVVLF